MFSVILTLEYATHAHGNIYQRGRNLKIMASKKVKAGTKLLIAEERVGELKFMPV